MPFAIDQDRLSGNPERGVAKLESLDINNPPVRSIPFQEFPRIVYKHPKRPFREVARKDGAGNTVEVTYVPTEHKSKSVASEGELKQALAEGWRTDPYLPKLSAPDPLDELYDDILPAKHRKAD